MTGRATSTGCTAEVRAVLRRQGGALTLAEILVKMKDRHDRKAVMSAISSMKCNGTVRAEPLERPRGGCRQAYRLLRTGAAAAPAPKSKCLLSEVWR
jgi:hypothetical protein